MAQGNQMTQQMKALPDGSIQLPSGTILPPIYRHDGTTIKPIAVSTGSGESRTVTVRRFAPVVFPDGEVVAEAIDDSSLSGLRWVKEIEGTATLTRRAKARGVVFYRDMCLGRIDGVEEDPNAWGLWLAVCKARGQNKIPKRGTLPPEKLYHAECTRRREANEGGMERMDQATIDEMIAAVEAEMSAEDHAEAFDRASELGVATEAELEVGSLEYRNA